MAWPSKDDNPLASEAFLSFHEFDAHWVPLPPPVEPPTCKGRHCPSPYTCEALGVCLIKRLA